MFHPSRRLAWAALTAALMAARLLTATPAAAEPPPLVVQDGLASWYGHPFEGRRTANGEVFRKALMTAASLVLPMHCIARVTNRATGGTIRVRINDRGPYVAGRIIDLSERAAERLGIRERGVARVRVTVHLADQTDPEVRRWLWERRSAQVRR